MSGSLDLHLSSALERAAQTDRGIYLWSRGAEEIRISYAHLAERAERSAAGLASRGIAPGETVLVVLPTGEDFLNLFFGCQRIGAIPCPMSPPQGFGSKTLFARRLGQLAELVAARLVVTSPELAERVSEVVPVPTVTAESLDNPPSTLPDPDLDPSATAFIQFTSGTTELPKGVKLSHAALSANVEQIGQRSALDGESTIVSWLPLYHDMGLIGGMLTAALSGADLVLTSPMSFLRQPKIWLELLDRHRGTHSPAPTFAYRYLLDRLKDQDLEGIDLSSWRVAYVGAEPISHQVLTRFEQRLAPIGLGPQTLLPCYGLAESSLAVTFSAWDAPHRSLSVSRRALTEQSIAAPPSSESDRQTIVSCGTPLPGTQVRIVADSGEECDEGKVGEILVEGPSLFSGYHGTPPRSEDEPLHTGDLGFLKSGELYVTGRKRDLIILRGENHHPAEIEWALESIPGLRPGRGVALGLEDPRNGTEALGLLLETDRRHPVEPATLAETVRRQVHDRTGLWVDRVEFVKAGTLPVTTSGKVQRSRALDILLQNDPGRVP